MLLVCLGLLSSCRKDPPPAIEICILDGHGGGDCVEADGKKLYRLPSEMTNYWSTGEADMKNFSSWCYGTTPAVTQEAMDKTKAQARGE